MEESNRTASPSVKRKILRTVGLAQNTVHRTTSPSRSVTMPKTKRDASRFHVRDDSLSAGGRNKPLKAGYLLRKQSGLLQRPWQSRWFVLTNTVLQQYASHDSNAEPMLQLAIGDYVVRELPLDNNDADVNYLFELSPKKGSSSMSLKVSEILTLSAESEAERTSWVRTIKQILFSDIGGAIFGQHLEITMSYEREQSGSRLVPEIVEMCVQYLRENGMDSEGLFRLPGRKKFVNSLRDAFDAGGTRPSLAEADINSVASLLKLYLLDLPEPIIPVASYDKVMTIITRQRPLDRQSALFALSNVLSQLPVDNRNLLRYLCSFLRDVSQHSAVNKMNAENLATIFFSCVIEPEVDDPALLAGTATNRTTAVLDMISEFDTVFGWKEGVMHDDKESSVFNNADHSATESTVLTESTRGLDAALIDIPCKKRDADVSGLNVVNELASDDENFSNGNTATIEDASSLDCISMCQSTLPLEEIVPLQRHVAIQNEKINKLETKIQQLEKQRDKLLFSNSKFKEELKVSAKKYEQLAKKLDEERNATKEAVQRVLDIQMELNQYKLAYGPLD